MKQFFCHLFLPQESNNHRAKLLHHTSILFLIGLFFITELSFLTIKNHFPDVLGTAVDLSSQELLLLTNQKRQENNLSSLVLNDNLSEAAKEKAVDMFSKNYWAHQAPDGTTPWSFITKSGYTYIYAGENLARGYTSSPDVVNAWMASPSHRENMLSSHYNEVGFAVMQGKLLGEDTTLVVEMFGSRTLVSAKEIEPKTKEVTSQHVLPQATKKDVVENTIQHAPLVPARSMSMYTGYALIGLFIFLFILDMILIERKKIVRHVGHNIDHILFFTVLLIVLVISQSGLIL